MRCPVVPIVLGAALLIVSCGDSGTVTPSVTNAAPAPVTPPPSSFKTQVAPADTGISVSGPIIVEHQVEITAQRDGILQKIFFDAPAHVQAGTLIANLDDRQITANLEAARAKSRSIAADLKNWEAEAEVLKADYGRAQRMWDAGLISEEQLQHAKYKAESDQWDIKRVLESLTTAHEEERSLELELEKAKILAPFDGLIARRYVREGQNIAKGERLFWVTAEAPLLMRVTLPERVFGKMRQGQSVDVTSEDAPGEKHLGRVKEISPVVDPSSGTFEVLVELKGERGALRPGMTANVHLDTQR
ncbi:MAG TPA: efflux RND transporter periplasmic adaptor subunit [Candidatus Acidoferrum sp.]|nr:efflux RND transporter periplasmic adaptor subunit [Candidatus Acidoferrum sp.]